jgi:hypothetical protein
MLLQEVLVVQVHKMQPQAMVLLVVQALAMALVALVVVEVVVLNQLLLKTTVALVVQAVMAHLAYCLFITRRYDG